MLEEEDNDTLFSSQEISDYIAKTFHVKLSLNALAVHRYRGDGAPFYRISGCIYYKKKDVTEWIKQRLAPRRYSGRIVFVDAS